MNDRTRKFVVRLIAVAGSSASAISVIVFGSLEGIVVRILLATLAGTLGHFAFTALGNWLMQMPKHRSFGPPGGRVYAFGRLPAEEGSLAGGKGLVETLPQYPIAGIILAAGAASRMGRSKLLLPWQGESLIRHIARTALQGGLDPVLVVTGSGAEEIRAALAGIDVGLVHNPDWQAGQSTSVRVGVLALPAQVDAALFLLGDQPYVSPDLIQALAHKYRETRPQILAPFVGDRRANPVLFDRSLFGALCALEGDAGGRSLFKDCPPTPMPWPDERLLLDIDTPGDYQGLLDQRADP